jgi:MFS family permease
VFEGKADYHKVSALIARAGDRLETVKQYIDPPLVSYEKEQPSDASGGGAAGGAANKDAAKHEPAFNIFAYLLAGLAGMFLLLLAGNGMTDLHRELRQHTFERYQTLRQNPVPFVAGKVVYAVVLLLIASAVMLGGGGLIFRIQWQQPAALALLVLGYACFASGAMAVLVALVPDERRAGVFTTVAGMILGLAGGCAFPPQQLPAFLREQLTPLLPSFWFVDTVRNMQLASGGVPWAFTAAKLFGVSAVLIGLAAFLFQRRFKEGMRA